jgi:uncharacterized protein YutE (UPF0331/DUF86 family)
MLDHDLVASKLSELADRLERVRTRRKASADELGRDRDALDLVAFNLMLAVQICADIASHLIADEGWAAAASLGAAFERLRDQGVISAPVCAALARAVGLRNVVAHGYAAVRPEMIHAAATAGLADLEAFSKEVATWIQRQEAR